MFFIIKGKLFDFLCDDVSKKIKTDIDGKALRYFLYKLAWFDELSCDDIIKLKLILYLFFVSPQAWGHEITHALLNSEEELSLTEFYKAKKVLALIRKELATLLSLFHGRGFSEKMITQEWIEYRFAPKIITKESLGFTFKIVVESLRTNEGFRVLTQPGLKQSALTDLPRLGRLFGVPQISSFFVMIKELVNKGIDSLLASNVILFTLQGGPIGINTLFEKQIQSALSQLFGEAKQYVVTEYKERLGSAQIKIQSNFPELIVQDANCVLLRLRRDYSFLDDGENFFEESSALNAYCGMLPSARVVIEVQFKLQDKKGLDDMPPDKASTVESTIIISSAMQCFRYFSSPSKGSTKPSIAHVMNIPATSIKTCWEERKGVGSGSEVQTPPHRRNVRPSVAVLSHFEERGTATCLQWEKKEHVSLSLSRSGNRPRSNSKRLSFALPVVDGNAENSGSCDEVTGVVEKIFSLDNKVSLTKPLFPLELTMDRQTFFSSLRDEPDNVINDVSGHQLFPSV